MAAKFPVQPSEMANAAKLASHGCVRHADESLVVRMGMLIGQLDGNIRRQLSLQLALTLLLTCVAGTSCLMLPSRALLMLLSGCLLASQLKHPLELCAITS